MHSQGAGSNWGFFPVLTWRWLDLLLLACFWLLFGCFCLQDSVSLLLRKAPALVRLLFLLALLGFRALQQPQLHPQLDDGLALLVNRLVQVIVLDLLQKGNKCQGSLGHSTAVARGCSALLAQTATGTRAQHGFETSVWGSQAWAKLMHANGLYVCNHVTPRENHWMLRTKSYLQFLILSLQILQDDLQLLLILTLTFTLRRVFLGFTAAVLLAAERARTDSALNTSSSLRELCGNTRDLTCIPSIICHCFKKQNQTSLSALNLIKQWFPREFLVHRVKFPVDHNSIVKTTENILQDSNLSRLQ